MGKPFLNPALATGIESAAYAVGSPTIVDVTSVVAGYVNATGLVAGSDVLGLFLLGASYSDSGSGTSKTYVSSATFSIDLTQVASLKDLQLAAVDGVATGGGFDTLRFEVIREGATVKNELFTNVTRALGSFSDRIMNFSDIEAGILDNQLDLTIRISLTTDDLGAGFRSMFVLTNSSLPLLDADFDNDADVDGTDFLIWQRGFGGNGGNGVGDANSSGAVDSIDLAAWQSLYGGAPTVPASGAVPEAASLTMLLLAIPTPHRRQRAGHTLLAGGESSRPQSCRLRFEREATFVGRRVAQEIGGRSTGGRRGARALRR